jgi:acyl-CoA thioesterase FadM
MVLYFRLLLTLIKAYFQPPHKVGEECSFWFRVMPWDAEFNFMNAARFFSFAEIAQWSHNLRFGFLKLAFKKRWWVVVRSNHLTYSGNVKKFSRFRVGVRLLGCDERYFYWESRFYKKNGDLFALGYSRVAVRNKRGVVSPCDAFQPMGLDVVNCFSKVPQEVIDKMATPKELIKEID